MAYHHGSRRHRGPWPSLVLGLRREVLRRAAGAGGGFHPR